MAYRLLPHTFISEHGPQVIIAWLQIWCTRPQTACFLSCHKQRCVNKAQNYLLCEMIHLLTQQSNSFTCNRTGFQKNMVSECVLHSHANLWPGNRNGPNNPSCTHSTPHTKLNVTYWHCVNEHVIFCRRMPVILRVRASTDVKPSYIVGERVWGSPSRTP